MRKANLFIFVQVVIHGSALHLQASSTCYWALHHSIYSLACRILFESTTIRPTI